MKCPKCNHVALEENAKFCSQCGTVLTQLSEKTQSILSNKIPDESTQSAVSPEATDTEMKTEINPDPSDLDNRPTAVSPKRPNDNSPNVKKKKKKKKKKRKVSEKDGGSASLTSDLSDISLTDKDVGRTHEEAVSSDSEESVCPMDETADLNLDTSAQAERQTSVSPGSSIVSSSKDKTGDPIKPDGLVLPETDAKKNLSLGQQDKKDYLLPREIQDQKPQCDEEPTLQDSESSLSTASLTVGHEQVGDQKKSKHEEQKEEFSSQNRKDEPYNTKSQKDESKKSLDQKNESKKSLEQKDESKKSLGQKDESKKSLDQKDESKKSLGQKDESKKLLGQKDGSKKSYQNKDASDKIQSRDDLSNEAQSILDQNANVDISTNARSASGTPKTKSVNQNEKKPEMVFGPQSKPEMKNLVSSSVDAPREKIQPLHSAHGKGDTSSAYGSSENKKKSKSEETDAKKDAPPQRIPTSTQQISASERLTIYFHAVLSKDFKFDPNEDRIFIRAGPQISDWETNLVELSVTRNLSEHGFLVEGCLVSTKAKAEAVSIPYKYVVYKTKKEKYEYEYIYKMDTAEPTNRCLFVKQRLLNAEGHWHQYDDIICAEPSKGILKRIKETFWTEQRKSVIEGKEIAGRIMLETIFDFLKSWTDLNFRNFITQLKQFHQIYGNPFVFEEKEIKWTSLKYTEKDVSNLIKNFMVEHVTPELQKDGSSKKSKYIQEPLKAAVLMLYLWKQYDLQLDKGELNRLCSSLCLPNLPKDEFLPFWTNVQESFSFIKNLPDSLTHLMNIVKGDGMSRWIVAIPLLHLLKGISKPFEPVSLTVNSQYEQSWAGLQGLKPTNTRSITSQDRRSMLNLMKAHHHLVEIDALLARSWMFLMPIDELVECNTNIHVELLDMLHLFLIKAPTDISYSSSSSVSDTLIFIQSQLLEQKYICFSDDYGRNCLAEVVKLLEKICNGVKSSYSHNYSDIPIACLNLVVSVSNFSQSLHQQIPEEAQVKTAEKRTKIFELLSDALKTIRKWIGKTYKKSLLQSYTMNAHLTSEIEMWNNIISISFESEEFTKEWRDTFTRDFEGKFQQVWNVCIRDALIDWRRPMIGCTTSLRNNQFSANCA